MQAPWWEVSAVKGEDCESISGRWSSTGIPAIQFSLAKCSASRRLYEEDRPASSYQQ